jgi:hypothetical protein
VEGVELGFTDGVRASGKRRGVRLRDRAVWLKLKVNFTHLSRVEDDMLGTM